MKRIFAYLFALLLAVLPLQAAAEIPQPGADFYYLDTANVLSRETEGVIYFCNALLQQECGGQIVIAALDSIGSADIYDFAYDLFNQWGIGSAEENNGFLLLMAIREENYYALAGSGIDGVFSSSVLKELNDAFLEPDFARGDYDAGALRYFEAVLARYADYYNLDIDLSDGERAYNAYAAQNGSGHPGGDAAQIRREDHHARYSTDGGFFSAMLAIIVLLLIVSVISKMRGGSFLMWSLLRTLGRSNRRRYVSHAPHRRANRRPPGGFGGGFGGGGGSFRGFGGARGGGGRSFGGGAGRGRH